MDYTYVVCLERATPLGTLCTGDSSAFPPSFPLTFWSSENWFWVPLSGATLLALPGAQVRNAWLQECFGAEFSKRAAEGGRERSLFSDS